MALLDRDASVRNDRSRPSSRQTKAIPSNQGLSGGDMFSAAASGVLSMLKTSTDSGDIGDLSFNTSRLPTMPRPAHRRRNNVARLSASSHHSSHSFTPSQVSKRNSNSQAWDAVSAISHGTHGAQSRQGRQGSVSSLQTSQTMRSYVPDARSPTQSSKNGYPASYDSRLTTPFSPDGRSYSLTQPQPVFGLRPHRSAASLRSQGSAPHQPLRNPYAYPTRLRRPGYRAPSPALSDFSGVSNHPVLGQDSFTTNGSSFESGYDRLHVNSHSHTSQRGYNGLSHNPNGGRSPLSQGPSHGRKMRRAVMPSNNNDYATGGLPASLYTDITQRTYFQPQPSLAIHATDRNLYHTGQMRAGPSSTAPPYWTSQLPPRMYTPQVDSLPSSSEQGSSAPPSSNPPTPKDATTIQVTLDPIFVDPALSQIPDEQTEPLGFPNYLKYAEKAGHAYELDAAEPAAAELSTETTSNRGGFVQRIKDILEDRSQAKSLDSRLLTSQLPCTTANQEISTYDRLQPPEQLVVTAIVENPVELPAVRTSFNVESEPENERGLNNTPVELEAPARLTRALIKANTAPSSSEQDTATTQPIKPEGSTSSPQESFLVHSHGSEVGSPRASAVTSDAPLNTTIDARSASVELATKDLTSPGENDYAVKLDIPVHVRHDITQQPRISSDGTASQPMDRPFSEPVSPIAPDEEVIRDSLVSPIPTQTIQFPNRESQHAPDAILDGQTKPPSPQSRPLSSHLSTDLSSNRFSLPPDLSLLNDPEITSEVVADLAVRLSVPRIADQGKPHLVKVNPIIEPKPNQFRCSTDHESGLRPSQEHFSIEDKSVADELKAVRSSSPLPITTDSTDLSSFIRRSFPRRQSVWPNDRDDLKRFSVDPVTETRFAGMKSLLGHLPGLKEESQEDMGIKEIRSSTSGAKISQPPVLASVSRSVNAHNNHTKPDQSARASYLASRAPRMTLNELRNIPSLNFSRLDLIDKLNEALDSHSTRSVEIVRRRKLSDIQCPFPLRPSSTETLRERYTSFFAKPEEFLVPEPVDGNVTDEEGHSTVISRGEIGLTQSECSDLLAHYETNPLPSLKERINDSANVELATASWRLRSPSMRPFSRPISPEELLNLAHDANRLSIPSVAALSERVTELLPSLKHVMLDSAIANENAVKETLEEIHHLGIRPDSDNLMRSSTGLRQMAAVADDIVTNGTHCSTLLDSKIVRLIKELPPLPEDTEKFSLSDSGLDRNTTTLGTDTLASLAVLESQEPRSTLLRVKSLNDMNDADQIHPGYPTSATKQSHGPSTHHSRPWNLDEYYPWASNNVDIDIDFPKTILRRNTSASTVLRRSKVSSDETSERSESDKTRKTARAKSPLADQSPTSPRGPAAIDATIINSRKISKRSLIGSLSRKIGLGGNKSRSGLQASLSPDTSTRPGDRYPSTALIPPSALNMDEVRSFFSDSTSDGSRNRGSFRKHINIFRSRLPGGPVTLSTSRLHSLEVERNHSVDGYGQPQSARSASSYDDRFTEPEDLQTYDGMVGMGRVEFRVKRVTECLRLVILKTGQLIRTLSHKRDPTAKRLQKARERAEWLDDSLYSGT